MFQKLIACYYKTPQKHYMQAMPALLKETWWIKTTGAEDPVSALHVHCHV